MGSLKPLPPPRRKRRLLWAACSLLLGVILAIILAVTVFVRVDTGEWRVPDTADFVRIARHFEARPSKTIYLQRHAVDLRPGIDDAAAGISSVLASGAARPAKTRAWTGGDARWKQVVQCVTKLFAPFAVTVTDQRPTTSDFVLVAVGGMPGDIGIKERNIGGLAPFNGGVIAQPIVFAFAAQSGNDVRTTCETIAMEVAHTYGLDHEFLCKDVMTYLRGCGAKTFVDADVPCGEGKKRACEGGAVTQNSFRRLLGVLGAATPRAAP